ncbi:MAG: hypothetical protein ACRC80_04615 [Waterburya sp.]
MANYLNFFVKIVTNLVIFLAISLCFIAPAVAVTQELQFHSTTGHIIKTTFSYDQIPDVTPIKEQGTGKTQIVDTLTISFYKPSGELIATYDNIVDGIVTGNYLEFNFDPATKKLLGNLDLGGELAGEMYLKGNVEAGLSLIEVSASGEERIIAKILR